MKTPVLIVSILLLLSGISAVSAASVVSATNPQDAAALVYVSGYESSPAVFYPGESGTVTVHVTNAANASVSLSQPNLIDPDIHVTNQGAFSTATTIGPGVTMDYHFVITAPSGDGTYFPLFSVSSDIMGAHPTSSQLKMKVDSTNIRASISSQPDVFSVSKKDTVNVSIVNPRLGDISDVLITETDSATDVSPSEKFVGALPAGGSVEVPFKVTPAGTDKITFMISFRNGDNRHSTSVVLPLNIGEDKTAALPIINNVELVNNGGYYTLTGDVTNSGVTDATGLVLTTDSPVKPVEPYSSYVVGALASNDFNSFTLTFTSGDLAAVPVLIQWKDSAGNTFTTTKKLDLRSLASGTGSLSKASGSSVSSSSSATRSATAGGPPGGGGLFSFGGSRAGGLSAFYPLIAGGILLIIAVVVWMKRKWIVTKLRKKQ
jgi:hypothetical protein